ncbi:MAG: multidrug effflux MFS transporter [Psychromonas sp.]|nr:multidrug effflux MFS transporter [Psychromonas sp.]
MTMIILSPMAIDIYLPSMPAMSLEFNVSLSLIQSTLGFFMFSMGVGQILIGPLADRFGRRPIALMGISLYIASSFLGANAEVFELLQTARVLQGIGACATSIVVYSAVRDSFTQAKSAQYYSYLNGAICIIPALAPSFGGFLALYFGWRSTFIFMTLFAILVLFIVIFELPETRPKNTDESGRIYNFQRYTIILKDRHFLFYSLACMAAMASILDYVSYAPDWLINHLGVSEMIFSALFGLNAVVNIIAAFVAPIVIKRFGNRQTVIIAFVTMLASAITQIVIHAWGFSTGLAGAYAFMLPMMLLGIGFSLLVGPATTMALSSFSDRAGTAAAILGCIQMSGAALLVALMQLSNLTAPYAVAFLIGGLMIPFLMIMLMPYLADLHQEKACH